MARVRPSDSQPKLPIDQLIIDEALPEESLEVGRSLRGGWAEWVGGRY